MLSQQRALRLKLPYPETREVLGWEVSKGPLGAAVVGKPEAAVVERGVRPTPVVELVKKQAEPEKPRDEFRNDCRTNH